MHFFWEQGLWSIAFDPDFASNGYLYVAYTERETGDTVISRFSLGASVLRVPDAASELIILRIPQPTFRHHGGTLLFDDDGYLLFAQGEGGEASRAQDTGSLLGSILRLDVRGATITQPYRVPPDNPFVGASDDVREEIWAYGFRNPWRLSIDHQSGLWWVADVGEQGFEEIDLVVAGGNYGWPIMEGNHANPDCVGVCQASGLTPPIFEYERSGANCAIIGGAVYRGSRLPALRGAYVYADLCSGRIWALRYQGGSVSEQALLVDSTLGVTAISADASGELYILTLDGYIYWLADGG